MHFKLFIATVIYTMSQLLLIPAANADEFKGKVIAVTDGDSMIVMRDNVKEKVILFGVDCPEKGQDFGKEARDFTDSLVHGKIVSVKEKGTDRYKRIIAQVYLPDGSDLNQQLVKKGLAWWSDKFAPNDADLKRYHDDSKKNHIGLWAGPKPIAPWIYRNGEKAVQGVVKVAQ